ncbi:MAG: PHP domain-containing protein, partial [Thermoguttaceae bacterium]
MTPTARTAVFFLCFLVVPAAVTAEKGAARTVRKIADDVAGLPAPRPGVAAASARIEPAEFPVYSPVSFRVLITPDQPITAGSVVEVQLPNSFTADKVSPSKIKAWQTNDPAGPHYVGVTAGNLQPADVEVKIRPREYVGGYSVQTRHGRCVAVRLLRGSVEKGDVITLSFANTTSPWIANQSPGTSAHEGQVLVMIDGQKVQPVPAFRVLPGPAVLWRLIVPSSARPGEPFRVQLVSLDAFNNLSSSTIDNVAVSCEGTVLKEPFSCTGRGETEVALQQRGVYRLQAAGLVSNPIRIENQPAGPYWGDIHFHDYPSVDAMGNIPYDYARNVSCLDFAGTAEHAAGGLEEHWAQTCKWCRQWNEPGRFVTILGLESATSGWHHNLYFYEDAVPSVPAQAKGSSNIPLEALLDYVKDKRVVSEIHHTGWGFDMRRRYPDSLHLLEIYSMHGTSELYDPESSLFMDKQRNRPGDSKVGPYYARDAWALGQQFVTMGSSDNHFGQPGVRHNSLTAVAAKELAREAILDAMVAGRCYATTGERILLDFSVNGGPMGSRLEAAPGRKLDFSVEVHGTGALGTVELFACPFLEGSRQVPVNQLMFAKEMLHVQADDLCG